MPKKSAKIKFEDPLDQGFSFAQLAGLVDDLPAKPQELAADIAPKSDKSEIVPEAAPARLNGVLRVSIERKGHAGKTVTILSGVVGDASALESFAKELKKFLGCGASIQDGRIILQGDQRERLTQRLKALGAKNVR